MGSIFGKQKAPSRYTEEANVFPGYHAHIDDMIWNQINAQRARHSVTVPRPMAIPQVTKPRRIIKRDTEMMGALLNMAKCIDSELFDVLRGGSTYSMRRLPVDTYEYMDICAKFRKTLNPRIDRIEIIDIQKNINPYVYTSFMLKLKQKERASNNTVFHGTSYHSALRICENNFDWRLAGQSVGHIFGRGTSFAKRSTYACHYPRNSSLSNRAMVVANILVTNTIPGDRFTIVPPTGYDATCKPNGDVVVKYDDAEYTPSFVIKYTRTKPLPPRSINYFD